MTPNRSGAIKGQIELNSHASPTPKKPRAQTPSNGNSCGSELPRHAPLALRSFPWPQSYQSGPAATSRLFHLHEKLAARKQFTVPTLARELQISERTIKRDIERLRDFHGAPIVWDPAAKAYRYQEPFDLLTGLHLNADETLAIVLAGHTFAAWCESPLGNSLTEALRKIEVRFPFATQDSLRHFLRYELPRGHLPLAIAAPRAEALPTLGGDSSASFSQHGLRGGTD